MSSQLTTAQSNSYSQHVIIWQRLQIDNDVQQDRISEALVPFILYYNWLHVLRLQKFWTFRSCDQVLDNESVTAKTCDIWNYLFIPIDNPMRPSKDATYPDANWNKHRYEFDLCDMASIIKMGILTPVLGILWHGHNLLHGGEKFE